MLQLTFPRARVCTALLLLLACACVHQAWADDAAPTPIPPPPAPLPTPIASPVQDWTGGVNDIHWIGNDKRIVFVLTLDYKVMRSEDGGATWDDQTKQMAALSGGDPVKIRQLLAHPRDPRKMVFLEQGSNNIWTTHSRGHAGNYTLVKNTIPFTAYKFHPRNPRLLLAQACYYKNGNVDPDHPACELYVTQDFCQTFNMVATYVRSFDWADDDEDGVFATVFHPLPVNSKPPQPAATEFNRQFHFMYGANFFTNPVVLVINGNEFVKTDKYVYVIRYFPNPYAKPPKDELTMEVFVPSEHKDSMRTVKATPVELPTELEIQGVQFVDASESSAMLWVKHNDATAPPGAPPMGNLYVSGSRGSKFSVSLERVAENHVSRVHGVEGVYIANIVGENSKMQTRISFDKGGVWSPLKVPANLECDVSDEDCYLHLHGWRNAPGATNRFPPLYSTPNAVGIVLASGNHGPFLRDQLDQSNTFLSRDAGLTWTKAHSGAFIYEIGDHGGIVVAVDMTKQTNTLSYSVDEGETWHPFQFADQAFAVENIVAEPESTTRAFVLYGSLGQKGQVVHVDFAPVLSKQCSLPETPGAPGSDYEFWTPSDQRVGQPCLLGHKISYTRRKQLAACFNGLRYEHSRRLDNCPCTDFDYECDVGYKRTTLDGNSGGLGPCTLEDESKKPAYPPAGCFPGKVIPVTRGYRLVPGDTCEVKGGVDHMPEQYVCKGITLGPGGSGGAGLVIAILISAAVGLCCAALYKNNDDFRQCLADTGMPCFEDPHRYGTINSTTVESLRLGTDDAFMDLGFDDVENEEDEESGRRTLRRVENASSIRKPSTRGSSNARASVKVPAIDGPRETARDATSPSTSNAAASERKARLDLDLDDDEFEASLASLGEGPRQVEEDLED